MQLKPKSMESQQVKSNDMMCLSESDDDDGILRVKKIRILEVRRKRIVATESDDDDAILRVKKNRILEVRRKRIVATESDDDDTILRVKKMRITTEDDAVLVMKNPSEKEENRKCFFRNMIVGTIESRISNYTKALKMSKRKCLWKRPKDIMFFMTTLEDIAEYVEKYFRGSSLEMICLRTLFQNGEKRKWLRFLEPFFIGIEVFVELYQFFTPKRSVNIYNNSGLWKFQFDELRGGQSSQNWVALCRSMRTVLNKKRNDIFSFYVAMYNPLLSTFEFCCQIFENMETFGEMPRCPNVGLIQGFRDLYESFSKKVEERKQKIMKMTYCGYCEESLQIMFKEKMNKGFKCLLENIADGERYFRLTDSKCQFWEAIKKEQNFVNVVSFDETDILNLSWKAYFIAKRDYVKDFEMTVIIKRFIYDVGELCKKFCASQQRNRFQYELLKISKALINFGYPPERKGIMEMKEYIQIETCIRRVFGTLKMFDFINAMNYVHFKEMKYIAEMINQRFTCRGYSRFCYMFIDWKMVDLVQGVLCGEEVVEDYDYYKHDIWHEI